MIKTIKVMLIPNNKQNTRLFQFAGTSRFAYNWALAKVEENYKSGNKFISDYDLRREFTVFKKQAGNEWLENVSNNVTKQAIKDACIAYKNFFQGKAKHPKFKSKKKSRPSFFQDNIKISFTDTHVKLEKLTLSRKENKQKLNYVRLAEHGRIPTDCKYYNPRITYDGLDWYISVGIDTEEQKQKLSDRGVGIDLGIKDLAICSDGNTYININDLPFKNLLNHT